MTKILENLRKDFMTKIYDYFMIKIFPTLFKKSCYAYA